MSGLPEDSAPSEPAERAAKGTRTGSASRDTPVERGGGTPAEAAPVDVAPYERLAELAEAELAACEAERPEDLADLYAEAETIRASLPATPPPEAEPPLRRAASAQAQIGHLLSTRLADRDDDLHRLHRARDAARAYATTAAANV